MLNAFSKPLLTSPPSHGLRFGVHAKLLEDAAYALLYAVAYYALACLSSHYTPQNIDIATWNPAVGASVIFLLMRGLKWIPFVYAIAFSSGIFFEHQSLLSSAIVSAAETLIYGSAVWLLKNRFKINLVLENLSDVVAFCSVMTAAAALMAIAYILAFYFTGAIFLENLLPITMQYWAGDALGILIPAPMFLLNFRDFGKHSWFKNVFAIWPFLQGALIFILVYAVFWAETFNIRIFYLFFIPVIGVAITYGLPRVPIALLIMQTSIIYFSIVFKTPVFVVTHYFPFFILALTWTGLILGALVSEKEQSRIQILKGGARLQALLDMAPDSMIIVDSGKIIVAVNRNFARLCGTTADVLLGEKIENVIPSFHPTFNDEATVLTAQSIEIPVEISTAKSLRCR